MKCRPIGKANPLVRRYTSPNKIEARKIFVPAHSFVAPARAIRNGDPASLHQTCMMTAANQPEIEKPADTKAEVRPSADKDPKLEDKIADEKDDELVDASERSADEIADHDAGFDRGSEGRGFDRTKSEAWRRGWADGQE
jgi:hypothetical protein